ncbi:tail fiber domain-containing protein [Photorhabdus asymbiotica]|uniref:tail fiber domain-containing protein n=1 Tax=Photorhabdus asymbiotica TaxID=291112 RepID=UPI003DA724F7
MWYREGTASFKQGHRIVTGENTRWNQTKYGVLPGMILIGPDMGLYEIHSIQSDTQLTLVEAYRGKTENNTPTRIVTTYEGDLSQFSARFSALLTSISKDATEIRTWLTSPDEISIVNDYGKELTVISLPKITQEHAERVRWFDDNQKAISESGDKAKQTAANAEIAGKSAMAAKASESQATMNAKIAADAVAEAKLSETHAKASEIAAKTSETEVMSSAKAAGDSALAAKTAENNVSTSAKAASNSQSAAKISEENAAVSAKAAQTGLSEIKNLTQIATKAAGEVTTARNGMEELVAKAADLQSEVTIVQTETKNLLDEIATLKAQTEDAQKKVADSLSSVTTEAKNAAKSAQASSENAETALNASEEISSKLAEATKAAQSAIAAEKGIKAHVDIAKSASEQADKSAKAVAETLTKTEANAKAAGNSATSAKAYEENAVASAKVASDSQASVLALAKAVEMHKNAAANSQTNADIAAKAAKTSETNAATSVNTAKTSEINSAAAAKTATDKANAASESAITAANAAKQTADSAVIAKNAYSKSESDARFQLKGNYANGEAHTFSQSIQAPNVFTGSGNNLSYFFQRDGVWVWTVQQNGSWRGEIKHPGRSGILALQGDAYTKGESDGKYQPKGSYAALNGNHSIDFNGQNGNFNDVYIRSDRRNKKNIRKIDCALNKLDQINGVLYEIETKKGFKQSGGLIAQDVQQVQPELVLSDKDSLSGDERLRLNYNGVIGLLVEAVKELQAEIIELRTQIKG